MRKLAARWVREPLFHFLILGVAIYLVFRIAGNGAASRHDEIVIAAGKIESLIAGWTNTWQRPPTQLELEGLIEDYIKEEIFYREALTMGLDRDDTIIRRRLRQKMEFLSEGIAGLQEPAEEDLKTFLTKNPDLFCIQPRLTFSHIYLNRDLRGESATSDAMSLLEGLTENNEKGDFATFGDFISLPYHYESLPENEVEKLFGHEFTARLIGLEPGRWQGPVESGYGLHLVFLHERTDGRIPEFSEAREAVRREWFAVKLREMNDSIYKRLREKYSVTIEQLNGNRDEKLADAKTKK